MADDIKIKALLDSTNIAETLDKQKLEKIGQDAKKGFEADLLTRQTWEDKMEEWIALAKQVTEMKTYPWRGASNVKYPLLSTAAMQFAARAYPALIPSSRDVVAARVIGKDQDGKKTAIADAVSIFMSWQLMDEMENWEEDMDRMLLMLPIIGVMFKKTYWDSMKKKNCSKLVLPKNLVVDYWTERLDCAERVSEILFLSKRKVQERQNASVWLDDDLGSPPTPLVQNKEGPPANDDTTPYTFIEQHTYLDLDDDEYPEPYIITFQRETGKVVRIVARFDQDCIHTDDEGKLIAIDAIQYYTKFGFIPSADGGFYDEGFGTLLGPINESVNTIINQLLDAGHLSSLQAGFLGKGLRLRMGETSFKPGEWKVVNATGDDLHKQVVPLPTKEPSSVLFQLMGTLITSGKELASVAEIFVGKMPGQNTPATTTMATIEQGMKVFTAVYKRIYRALGEEFQKLYRLNSIYTEYQQEIEELGLVMDPDMFDNKSHKIYPGADPTAISQTEKLMKAQGLMELLPTGVLDPVQVVSRVLDAQEQPNWKELLSQAVQQTGQLPPPPPDPKLQEMQMKSQMDQQKTQSDIAATTQKSELAARDSQTQLAMKSQMQNMEMQHAQQKAVIENAYEVHKQKIRSATDQLAMNQKLMQAEQAHQLKMKQMHETHQMKLHALQTKANQPQKGPTKK